MEYFDSGNRVRAQTLLHWLESALVGATYFGCQTGYFTADGLFAIRDRLDKIAEHSGEVHLVVGANEDSLASSDLVYALESLKSLGGRGSLTVVSAPDALMHSKTYYVEDHNGRRRALVGSANLTPAGLSTNIEAGLAIDSATDGGAPFDAIKEAIEAWRTGERPNGFPVTENGIARLSASGVIDRPRPMRARNRSVQRRVARLFPRLGAIQRVARRPRRGKPPVSTGRNRIRGATSDFPKGAVGIVKQLSRLDTKGFRGEPGTPYLALPVQLVAQLPMRPSGANQEPRLDVPILARLDGALAEQVSSGEAPTNITGVGMGIRRRSHRDLRLNILKVTVDGISFVAQQRTLPLPRAGDYVIVEFPINNPEIRLTFVREDPLVSRLKELCEGNTARGNWAWVPAPLVPRW